MIDPEDPRSADEAAAQLVTQLDDRADALLDDARRSSDARSWVKYEIARRVADQAARDLSRSSNVW